MAAACAATGIGRRTHYNWLSSDSAYADRFEEAKEEAVEMLETEARRRAMSGVERILYYKGQEIGRERHYSDRLLMFLLKAARPEKYRERYGGEAAGRGRAQCLL